jgi:hypothetical protein
MKIVNKKEFYALPEGTLYSDYEPCIFTSLKVKQSTLFDGKKPIDFIYESLIGNIEANSSDHFVDMLDDSENNKSSLPMDFECGKRDGLFEEEQLFAIYEKKDLEDFIQKLESLRSVFSH